MWRRRDDESDAAYSAFKIYLEMPERSHRKLSQKLGKSRSQINQLSKKYDWVKRARAYDSSIVEGVRAGIIDKTLAEIERKKNIADKLENKALTALEQIPLQKISARVAVEMLTLSNQLRGEALTLEKEKDSEDDKVTEIKIIYD